MNKFLWIACALIMSGCTTFEVVERDPETGLFPTNVKANVIENRAIETAKHVDVVLVPNGDFTASMIKKVQYFGTVMTFEELETIIIKSDLTDQVPSLDDRIGINRAAKAYEPFLWLHWDVRDEGNDSFTQLALTDPITLDNYFLAETEIHSGSGLTDQSNFYPLLNSLIEYLDEQQPISQ